MLRIFFWALLAAVVLWKLLRPSRTRQAQSREDDAPPVTPAAAAPAAMVACAHCGLHIPLDEAFSDPAGSTSAKAYCSREHLRQAVTPPGR